MFDIAGIALYIFALGPGTPRSCLFGVPKILHGSYARFVLLYSGFFLDSLEFATIETPATILGGTASVCESFHRAFYLAYNCWCQSVVTLARFLFHYVSFWAWAALGHQIVFAT